MSSNPVFVYIHLGQEQHLVGRLWCHTRRGRESSSFEYDNKWLEHPEKFALEPALALTKGAFHSQKQQTLFGAIGDSAPDRWGRVLMRRANLRFAKMNQLTPKSMLEKDYLLGVNDFARTGALRFSESLNGPFLAQRGDIPPIVDLPKLLSVTDRYLHDDESENDLKLLLAPGSSLGGARPKASILDKDQSLSIAKFPKHDDEYNIVLWEYIAYLLARNAGIRVASMRLLTIAQKPILIVKRFDRANQMRIPFLSAMSMLGALDNEFHSYLEIAYAISQYGAHPTEDLAELWKRIVFNILISNTDDHLRNHGFLYERYLGWSISPAYDLNPVPIDIKPRVLTTAIDFENNTASLDTALSVIGDFRLTLKEAKEMVKEVVGATKQWRELAKENGISSSEIDRMKSAFEHEDYYYALNI